MRRRGLALAVTVVLATTLAACGDDGDGGEAADTTASAATTAAPATTAVEASTTAAEATTTTEAEETTTTVAAPTGEPIKLMTIFEGTGASATPEVPEGAKGAAEAINAAGGIAGRPVEIIECDAGNDPNQAAECGRQAVSEGVVAVVGALSANAGSYMPILAENRIPAVGNVPAAADDFLSEASFPIYGGLPSAAAGLAGGLAGKGATTISVARVELAAAAAIALFANAALQGLGLEVKNDVSVPAGAPDMATYVASTMEGGTDGVIVGLFGQDATNFIIQMRQTNPDVRIAATATDFSAVIDALGASADGIIVTQFFYLDGEAVDAYEAAMEAAGYDDFSGFRLNSYASVETVAEIVADLPEITSQALWDTLPTVEGLDIGLMPPLQFKTGGAGGIPRLFNVCTQYAELQDGEPTVFSDGFVDPFSGAAC